MASVLSSKRRVVPQVLGGGNVQPGTDPTAVSTINNPGQNANPSVPATHYATVNSPLSATYTPNASEQVRGFALGGAPIVSARFRRNGTNYMRTWGVVTQRPPQTPIPVLSSRFQPQLNHLFNAQTNSEWYGTAAPASIGLLRPNPSLSFRAAQLQTQTTGGPTVSRMNRKPRFSSVQLVPRYTAQPSVYDTTSAQG